MPNDDKPAEALNPRSLTDIVAAFEIGDSEQEPDHDEDSFASFTRRAGFDDTALHGMNDPQIDDVDPEFFVWSGSAEEIEELPEELARFGSRGTFESKEQMLRRRGLSDSDSSVPVI